MKLKLRTNKQEPFERRRPGNDSPKVFSYYARGATKNNQNLGRHESENVSKRNKFRKLIYLPSYIALGMVIIALLYSCWLQPSPKVVIVNVEGTVSRPSKDYQNGIEEIWRESILNQTKFTVNTDKLKTNVLGQYAELADAKIELPLLGRRPTIVLSPDSPALLFVSINGEFYVNSEGKVMAKASDVKQNQLQNVPTIRDEANIPAEVGKGVVPVTEATFLRRLYLQLLQEGITAEAITLSAFAANQVDVKAAGQPFYIKFSSLSDPRQAVGTYMTVKRRLDADHIVPKEYIDIRVEEKAFYR